MSTASILVVEDEPMLLEMLQDVLEESDQMKGTYVTSSEEALKHLKSDKHLSLLLTDYNLDEAMNGLELSLEATSINTGLKIVIVTGEDPVRIQSHPQAKDFKVIQKPYLPFELKDMLEGMVH